jgi:23S rRNA pseudouridine1911/1915/1917 synthase
MHGQRLDLALVAAVPEFSRSYLQQLVTSGHTRLNGGRVTKVSTRVRAGDILSIELLATPQSQAFRPEPMQLGVVYQDEHLLVLDKPAGLVVHPAPGNWSGTLLNGLLAFDSAQSIVPRAGIVHRLDKDTSGLMVVARSRMVMDLLVAALAAREVRREYLAVAHAPWLGPRERTVEAAIGRDTRYRLRMAVVDQRSAAGKAAKTDFRLLDSNSAGCLVHCKLHTGRTHQIRVHLASIGHPLVADTVYGGVITGDLQRQALHAGRLAFRHPVTGEELSFVAPLAADIVELLRNWGLSYNPAHWALSP